MFVKYRYAINYVVEAVIMLLFVAGIWAGRKSKYLWLVMSYFGLDMMLHIGLGFGLNEVYIMAAHWMFVIPFTMGYAFREAQPKLANAMRGVTLFLAIYFWAYNATLIITHFL